MTTNYRKVKGERESEAGEKEEKRRAREKTWFFSLMF